MQIDQTQQRLRTFTGTYVNPLSEVYEYSLMMTDLAESLVKRIMKETGHSRARVIVHVQNSVISYEDTLEFAERFAELPCECTCEEIYLLGWETWIKLNDL